MAQGFTREWKISTEIEMSDRNIPVRQVYIWLFTSDEQLIIVSKDGSKWQLPGGKPEQDESLPETAVREVLEETGVDIAAYRNNLKYFGYYIVNEAGVAYLQVRMCLALPVDSNELNLHAQNESEQQSSEDMIRFVSAVGVREIAHYIPWMPTVEEYHHLVNNKIISE